MLIAELRREYHERVCKELIRIQKGGREGLSYPNFADGHNLTSIQVAWGVARRLGYTADYQTLKAQTAGGRFELVTRAFIEAAFQHLEHLRPGKWHYSTGLPISQFDQYEHLADLQAAVKANTELASVLGQDYIVAPDIVVGRWAVSDAEINEREPLVTSQERVSRLTPLRLLGESPSRPILHASISCKWTLRSDRSQNARTEALNLIRNRKGHTPHIMAVTAEPLPTRIASLALGTGDLDCVYHFALYELQESLEELGNEDQLDMLHTLISGRRLRDISDLPFDLAI